MRLFHCFIIVVMLTTLGQGEVFARIWKMQSGQTIDAEITGMEGDFFIFQCADGRILRTLGENLVPEDRTEAAKSVSKSTAQKDGVSQDSANMDPAIPASDEEKEIALILKLADFFHKENFPVSCMKISAVLDNRKARNRELGRNACHLTLSFDLLKYREFLSRLRPLLEEMAVHKSSGTFLQEMPSDRDRDISVFDLFWPDKPVLLPNQIPLNSPADHIVLYVYTGGKTADLKSTRWVGYVLPARYRILIALLESITPISEVTFLDRNDQFVAEQFIPLLDNKKDFVPNGVYPVGSCTIANGYLFSDGRKTGALSIPHSSASGNHFLCPFFYRGKGDFDRLLNTRRVNKEEFYDQQIVETYDWTVKTSIPLKEIPRIVKIRCRIISDNPALDAAMKKLPAKLKSFNIDDESDN